MWLYLLFAVILLLVLGKLFINYISGNHEYWTKQGIPVAMLSECCSLLDFLTGRQKFYKTDLFYYNRHPEAPLVGVMEMGNPALIIRDLDLIKRVFIKDFDHFVNRRSFNLGDETSNFLLFNMKDQDWKDMRSTMSPTFTTGKIRRMFQHFHNSGENLVKYVEKETLKGGSSAINLKEMFGRYTMDVVASTAFGMDSGCLTDPQGDSHFFQMGMKLQAFDAIQTAKMIVGLFFPKIFSLTGLTTINKEALDFFKSVTARALKERRSADGKNYSDFLQLMVETARAQDAGETLKEEAIDDFEKDAQLVNVAKKPFQITDTVILANGLSFFLGGFDTTETVMTFTAYYLAVYPDMQERLREEVDDIIQDDDGKITYEGITKMVYLDMIVSEVLRIYAPITRAERMVTKPYQIPGTDIVLPVGMIVILPVLGLHRDPKIYPDPEKFDPERFSPENKQNRNPYAYLPFGHGPRSCIGNRFALTESKAAIAHLVKNFEITPCAETCIPVKLDEKAVIMKIERGMKVNLTPR